MPRLVNLILTAAYLVSAAVIYLDLHVWRPN